MTDPCLVRVQERHVPDLEPLVKFGLRYAGVLQRTPLDRFEEVVKDELAYLVETTTEAVGALPGAILGTEYGRKTQELLKVASGDFPRDPFLELSSKITASPGSLSGADADALSALLKRSVERHQALEKRVGWLLDGTPSSVIETLDPALETDRIHHAVTSTFRFESRVLEMMAINRIAQSASIGTFFRSTKEAESNPIFRFFDTYALYSNVFEWGLDSRRGGGAVKRMNQIHGRYYIPNDGMKFVLVQGAFTWLDGADRIAHRRVSDIERRAMFLAWARMGRAMLIQDLTDDYDEMYAWYRAVCEANKDFTPQKRDTYETIVRASASGQPEELVNGLLLSSRVAMDETFIRSVGYESPTAEQKQAVKAVFFTVGSFIENLPYTPFARSLQNSPARRELTSPLKLGMSKRSGYMPKAQENAPNDGFPEWQAPIRSEEDVRDMEFQEIPWDEIKKHNTLESLWVVLHGYVYDLTPMVKVHPGGNSVLVRWGGLDASRAFDIKHSAATKIFSLNYRIGRVPVAARPSVSDQPLPLSASAKKEKFEHVHRS